MYFKWVYYLLSKYIEVVVGPVITEKSLNENGHTLLRISGKSKRLFKMLYLNDFSDYLACNYDFIYSKRIYMYYRLSKYIKVILGPVITSVGNR